MGFRLLKLDNTVNFMRYRVVALVFSALLIVGSIGSLAVNQLNWGLDFTGGTEIQVAYPQGADREKVRSDLAESNFPDAVVQNFGSSQDVLIRIALIYCLYRKCWI